MGKLQPWIAVTGSLLLSACATLDNSAAAVDVCDQVQVLVNQHQNGFVELRRRQTSARFMDVWRADYQLVGNDCQIWGWGKGRHSYVCSVTEPNQQTAELRYEQAKNTARRCLSSQWALVEDSRDLGEGQRVRFRQAGSDTIVAVMTVAAPALFKTEWRTYYFVGDIADLK